MKPNESWQRERTFSDRIVMVDATTYAELLISRRKLERLGDQPSRLVDLETREIFVNQAESVAARARSA